MKHGQNGFSLTEAALIILIAAAVGFSGWYIYSAKADGGVVSDNPSPTTGKTTPSPTPNPTHTSVNITDSDNGKTIDVGLGQSVVVTLASTYWTIGNSSNPGVIKMAGSESVNPVPGCVPGEGCGTAVANFTPVAAGTATITASRTSCGEAMACTGSSGKFSVTVVVK